MTAGSCAIFWRRSTPCVGGLRAGGGGHPAIPWAAAEPGYRDQGRQLGHGPAAAPSGVLCFNVLGPRAQVEADIRPFRGLLLGLFFVTTGASLDVGLLLREWEIVAALLVGLIAVKILIIGSIAPFFGLNRRAGGALRVTRFLVSVVAHAHRVEGP